MDSKPKFDWMVLWAWVPLLFVVAVLVLSGMILGRLIDGRQIRQAQQEAQDAISAAQQAQATAQEAIDAGNAYKQEAEQDTTLLSQCAAKPADLEAAPADDAGTITLIADESISAPENETAGAAPASPLVAIADLMRPDLGDALSRLTPVPASSVQPQAPRITRWAVQGRVTPYLVTTSADQVGYAWINVTTGEISPLMQPQPARALVAAMKAKAQ